MHRFPLFVAVVALSLLAGCLQIEEDYTLNPDGSGKVRHVAVLHNVGAGLFQLNGEEPTEEERARTVLRDELSKARGVDAWRDLAVETLDDGRVRFAGTAYFREINELAFHNNGVQTSLLFDVVYERRPGGTARLRFLPAEGEATAPPSLTDEEVQREIKQQRAQYNQQRMVLGGMVGDFACQQTFHLPGKVSAAPNLARLESGAVRLAYTGTDLLNAMDRLMGSDERMQQQVRQGMVDDEPPRGPAWNELLLGEAAPIQADMTLPLQVQFDYETEVAAAKEACQQQLAELGLAGAAWIQPAPATGEIRLAELRVVGVRYLVESTEAYGLQAFNFTSPFTLALLGEFTAPVREVDTVVLQQARTANGEDLLPEDDWDRKSKFPKLSDNGRAVLFDVALRRPSPAADTLAVLAGTLMYNTASSSKTLDLGIARFAGGVQGQQLGAQIKSVQSSTWQAGHEELQLQLETPVERIEAVRFYNEQGQRLEVNRQGSMSSGASCTLEFVHAGPFPAGGRIEVDLFADFQVIELPFTLKNIPLYPRPKKKN